MLSLKAVRDLVYAEPPATIEDAAEELGISTHQMRCARDIIYLWDEPDLTVEELGPISDAMKLIAVNKISDARELIDPLMERRFGGLTKTQGGPLIARENAREQFGHAVASLVSSMDFARDIPVPFLAPADRDRLIRDIESGIRSVRELKAHIENAHNNNQPQDQGDSHVE